MKKYCIWLTVTLLLSLAFHNAYCQYQTEGLVKVSDWMLERSDSTKVEELKKEEKRIWFKDSCLVYEFRIHLQSQEQTLEGTTIVKKSIPVERYIFIDLKTMLCQDYLHFQDTAKPLFNYTLTPQEALSVGIGKFFNPKTINLAPVQRFQLSDTSINSVVFKRVKILSPYYEQEKEYTISYLKYNDKQNIFSPSLTLGKIYPGCYITRSDFYDAKDTIFGRFEYEVISDKLNEAEEGTFKQWHENALNTKLPLLSFSEVRRIQIPLPEHENPVITILPRKEH